MFSVSRFLWLPIMASHKQHPHSARNFTSKQDYFQFQIKFLTNQQYMYSVRHFKLKSCKQRIWWTEKLVVEIKK